MSTFRLYWWKEWREHRLALAAVAGISAALLVGTRYLAPPSLLGDALFSPTACAVVVLITLLAVGGEMLAERRERGIEWLARLPAALPGAFVAKLTFHLVTTLVAGAIGLALGRTTAWLASVRSEPMDVYGALVLLVTALVALWTFASSAWSSRAVLSWFGGVFVVAGLGAPVGYLVASGYRPSGVEFVLAVAVLLLGAVPSAWLGFVTGGRFGRGPSRRALLGFSSAVLCFAPFWAWSGYQLHLRDVVDPECDGFQVLECAIAESGRVAYCQTRTDGGRWSDKATSRTLVRVDLSSGEFESLGRGRIGQIRMASSACRPYQVIVLIGEHDKSSWFDAASGKAVPDGVGITELRHCSELRDWYGPVSCRENDSITDVITGKTVRCSELDLPNDAWVWSDHGAWYAISAERGAFTLDPDSGRRERAEWLDAASWRFGPRLPDGRFFVPLRDGGIGLVDPARMELRTLETNADAEHILRPWGGPLTPFAEGEAVFLWTGSRLYRFDPRTDSLERLPFPLPRGRVVASEIDQIFALEEGRLVVYALPTGERTALFPRSSE